MNIDEINKFIAPSILSSFFTEIRDTRPGKVGNMYEQVTLTTYKNGLRRYFLNRTCPPAVDNFDIAASEFDCINKSINIKKTTFIKDKTTKWSTIDNISDNDVNKDDFKIKMF